MSVVRIFFNPLDARSLQEYPVEPGIQLIDFLQEHYPTGFDGVLRVFVGTTELAIEDLDYVVDDADQVTMLVMPSGAEAFTIGTLYKILIQVAVAAAIGLVINYLFAPETPGAGGGGDESPVYSLNPTRNEARLGSPISAHYGTVSYPPDFASAPYVFFSEASNDMFVDELLCLGHGDFVIDELYIGDTPFSTIETGTVKYWVYGPDDHQQRLGNIAADVWNKVKDSETPFPFSENTFTSPEVEGWEFNDDVSETTLNAPLSGSAFAAGLDPGTGAYLLGRIVGVDSSLVVRVGDTVTLAGTTSNNISFVVGSVVNEGGGTQTIFQQWAWGGAQLVDEDPLNGAATITVDGSISNMVAGPFRAQKLGQQVTSIDCDVMFPNGLYRIDGTSGNIKTGTVEVQFTYQQVSEATGDPIGAPIVQSVTSTEKRRNAVRYTHSSGPLPQGAYDVTVERLTPMDDDSRKVNNTVWSGLKGNVLLDTNQVAYGKVTLMAIRLKATNGLAQAARSRIRVTARRVLASGDSDNPITIIKDIWSDPNYGMGRPLSELHPELDTLETDWATTPSFNGSFDQRGTGFEGMQRVASLAAARVVQNGGYTTVVPDREQTVRTAMFTSANILQGTFEINYSFDSEGDFDGIQVEYRNPDNFEIEYAVYPAGAVQPEPFNLFGCTDPNYAIQFATYMWNVRTIRRKTVKLQTELEGLIPRFGDRVSVSHPMPDWGQSGVFVEQLDTLVWQVDQALDWAPDRRMILRTDTGEPTSPVAVKQGPNPNQVEFLATPPITIYSAQSREPTSYAFGGNFDYRTDFLVSKISPKGDSIVEVEGQLYSNQIYDGGPYHMREEV